MNQSVISKSPMAHPSDLKELKRFAMWGASRMISHRGTINDIGRLAVERFRTLISSEAEKDLPIQNIKKWGYDVGKSEGDRIRQQYKPPGSQQMSKQPQTEIKSPGQIATRIGALGKIVHAISLFELQIKKLEGDEHRVYEAWFLDWRTGDQIARQLGIKSRLIKLRWGELLRKIHRNMIKEVSKWSSDNSALIKLLEDPEDFAKLVNLLKTHNLSTANPIVAELIEKISPSPVCHIH